MFIYMKMRFIAR